MQQPRVRVQFSTVVKISIEYQFTKTDTIALKSSNLNNAYFFMTDPERKSPLFNKVWEVFVYRMGICMDIAIQ